MQSQPVPPPRGPLRVPEPPEQPSEPAEQPSLLPLEGAYPNWGPRRALPVASSVRDAAQRDQEAEEARQDPLQSRFEVSAAFLVRLAFTYVCDDFSASARPLSVKAGHFSLDPVHYSDWDRP